MADNDQEITVGAVPVVAQGSNKMHFLLMGLSILVMVLTPLITILALKMMSGKEGQEPKDLETPPIQKISIEGIKCNVANTSGTRFLSAAVYFEVDTKTVVDFLTKDAPKNKHEKIKARILEILSDKPLLTLLSQDGKKMITTEIRREVNDLLEKNEVEGQVRDVFFTEFLVQ